MREEILKKLSTMKTEQKDELIVKLALVLVDSRLDDEKKLTEINSIMADKIFGKIIYSRLAP